MYYNREGELIDLWEWASLFELIEYRRVAYTDDVLTKRRVSTVWMGLDHSLGCGSPIIFESMAWQGDEIVDQHRYSTETEAIAGHVTMCKKWEVPYNVPVPQGEA